MKYFFLFLASALFINSTSQTIHWQHFDTLALQKAKQENKPILLHLAANWCHWCHVMEEKNISQQKCYQLYQQIFYCLHRRPRPTPRFSQ
ncbi:MAG: hypothetical protein KatS3mg027_1211 [Bacteroidia bacterium]|nr:MAG: hypothetical protein KatS3mg027_1211 [Bacteroidia bacterium]